jgi:N-acetyl-anhydromuramyl-L-alanine amidase AmpD
MSTRTYNGLTEGLSVDVDFRPCPNFTRPRRGLVTLLCVHTAEMAEIKTAAEALALWVSGPLRPKNASWHCAVDSDSITQSVEFENEAWHAGPVNPVSIGVELSGFSAQTRLQWADQYSQFELYNVAKLFAVLCEKYQLPVRRISVPELHDAAKTGKWPRGIIGHIDVTKAISGTHTDPGPNFPWLGFLGLVQQMAPEAPAQ